MRLAPLLLALLTLLAAALPAHRRATRTAHSRRRDRQTRDALRDRALGDDTGWKIVESLTTEVGPRLAGSEADARAVQWAVAKFKQLGFDKVWTEPVTFPKWERRSEHARGIRRACAAARADRARWQPGRHGRSRGRALPRPRRACRPRLPVRSPARSHSSITACRTFRDGHDYGIGGGIRRNGPSAAIRAGAAAFLMRSAGTDSHRMPHTGITALR